ncbi:MAG: DNA-directed RNA polymerase [Candidatus Bathyarchaeota archaeon]|nr:MAG: DNA-directed RNA polymerase [Candidatus Bathyarchaeota archaeon]
MTMSSHGVTQERHEAVCADCGKECMVPFKPNKGRPVYCKECWADRRPPIERLY